MNKNIESEIENLKRRIECIEINIKTEREKQIENLKKEIEDLREFLKVIGYNFY